MYCGSCLRDNALAAELLARGHDVVLTPVYTPTRTDERNVSAAQVFFGGISVFLEQQVPRSSGTRRGFSTGCGMPPWVLRLATKRQIKVDPKSLGEMTVSMLRGEHGFQAKEIDKLLEWLRTEPRFDVINLPYSLLLGLAEPLKRELKAPICCTLQGEDLFLDGLGEPYREQAMTLIQPASVHVDAFLPVSQYYLDYMPGYLGVPRAKMRLVPLGHQHGRVLRRGRRASATARSRSAISRASRRRRGCTFCARPTASCAVARASVERGWSPPDTCRRNTSRISSEIRRRCASGGSSRSSSTAARSIARRRSPSCRASTSCRCRRPTRSRRGCSCSRRWRAACPSCSRAAARFRRSSNNTGGGLIVEPDDPDGAGGRAARRCGAIPTGRRARRAAGAAGVREHYTSAAWPKPVEHGLSIAVAGLDADLVLKVESTSRSRIRRRAASCRSSTGISLSLERGAAVAIMGPSGSGKSTLLYILGALEPPSSGTVTLDGQDPYALGEREQAAFRNQPHRLRVPGSLAAAAVLGARERAGADARGAGRRAADGATMPSGRTHMLAQVGLARPARSSARASCRAARSSAPRSRARSSGTRAAAVRRADRQPRSRRSPTRSPTCCSSCTRPARRSWSS